ncbi:acetyl-CoA synthetase-like protein [Xylariaceae sp. FL1019]|nr:acetyl-CoA synthetase-like protein [Xylariaceae sp. FL1019]
MTLHGHGGTDSQPSFNDATQSSLEGNTMKPLPVDSSQSKNEEDTKPARYVEKPTVDGLSQIWRWNAVVPEAIHRYVHDIVWDQIQMHPDSPAVCAWDGNLSYVQLGLLASNLAASLLASGISKGSFVPICSEKSMWTTVAILGILEAGAAFVLLDPSIPELRLRVIVSQLKASVVVSSKTNEVLGSRLANQVIVLGSQMTDDDPQNSEKLQRQSCVVTDTSSPMYVAFTSGSTGTPKGAIITHANLASALFHQKEALNITSESRMYDFCSYSFDVSICNIFATLTAGGCLCVPNEADRQNRLAESIALLKANTIDLTPSVSQLLRPEQVPSLKQIIFGGEALRVEHVRPWWDKVRIVSLYGPCECTPNSTINSHPASPDEAVHMGKGIGLNTWIVDPEDHDNLLPSIGAVGELLLEGPLVGSGYLNEPEKTATAFISNPVWLTQGCSSQYPGRKGRLYKTGDLVRYNQDGSVSFVGRTDDQVKIRGQRVELGEIENVLRDHQKIKDSVVMLQKDENRPKEQWLAGFVTIHDDEEGANGTAQDRAEEEAEHVHAWEKQFSDDYLTLTNMQPEDLGRDFMGWTSMYDGSEIDKREMNEWLDDTLDSIRNSGITPQNVLEIGSGSGMILFNLIRGLKSYTGLEPSSQAVEFITRTVQSKMPPAMAAKISMNKATAADIGRLGQSLNLSPDLVVLNSVIQYFPSLAYLHRVVKDLVQLQGVKTIFFGDIRSFPLYSEFLVTRALHVAGNKASKDELHRVMNDMKKAEAELLVDPAFFTALPNQIPSIEHVEILPKRMRATNELSAYRYEAVIHVRAPNEPSRQVEELDQAQWIDFQAQELSRESLLAILKTRLSTPSAVVPVSNILNGRTASIGHVLAVLNTKGEEGNECEDADGLSSAYADTERQPSLSAADLVELAKLSGSRVELSWARQSSQSGSLDAVFHTYAPSNSDDASRVLFRFPTDHQNSHTGQDAPPFGNEPVHRQQIRHNAQIQDELHEILQARIPPYMHPQVITILDRMPLTANGKIDRRALAKTIQSRRQQSQSQGQEVRQEPQLSGPEDKVRSLWSEVLGIQPVSSIGPDDSFFQLGGDSMAAMNLVGLARKAGLELTVRHIFRHPKLHDLVRALV